MRSPILCLFFFLQITGCTMQFQFAVIESEGDFSFNISLLVCGDGVDSFGADGVCSNNRIVQLSTINIRINDILSFVELRQSGVLSIVTSML